MRWKVGWETLTESSPKFSDRILRALFLLLGFTLGAFCAASAQQESDLQQQLQQLKTQYQQSTDDMQRRIAALEQKIAQDQLEKEKEQEKGKSETVSAVQLAAESAEKSILGQSNQVGGEFQGAVPAAPTYDFLHEAEQRIAKLQEQVSAFEFHGYFRSGYGLNSLGGEQVAFQAPGAAANTALAMKPKPMRN